jgi:hypothetical protein
MNSFKEWLNEGGNDVTVSNIGPAANVPSSQMNFSVQPPVGNTLPWQMNQFKNWYNSNRGNWSDVDMAAQKNPAIKAFLKQAAYKLINAPKPTTMSKNPYDDHGEFDLEAPTVTGTVADELEQMVKQIVPTHGQKQNWQVPSTYKNKQPSAANPLSNYQSPDTEVMGAIKNISTRQDQLEKKVQDIDQRTRAIR